MTILSKTGSIFLGLFSIALILFLGLAKAQSAGGLIVGFSSPVGEVKVNEPFLVEVNLDFVGQNQTRKPLDILLVLDSSESMRAKEKIDRAKEAIASLVETISANQPTGSSSKDRIGFLTFGDKAKILTELTTDYRSILDARERIEFSGDSDIASGLLSGNGLLSKDRPEAIKYLLLIADGAQQPAEPKNCGKPLSPTCYLSALSSSVTVDVFSLGGLSELDLKLFGRIAAHRGPAGRGLIHHLSNPKGLPGLFQAEADRLIELGSKSSAANLQAEIKLEAAFDFKAGLFLNGLPVEAEVEGRKNYDLQGKTLIVSNLPAMSNDQSLRLGFLVRTNVAAPDQAVNLQDSKLTFQSPTAGSVKLPILKISSLTEKKPVWELQDFLPAELSYLDGTSVLDCGGTGVSEPKKTDLQSGGEKIETVLSFSLPEECLGRESLALTFKATIPADLSCNTLAENRARLLRNSIFAPQYKAPESLPLEAEAKALIKCRDIEVSGDIFSSGEINNPNLKLEPWDSGIASSGGKISAGEQLNALIRRPLSLGILSGQKIEGYQIDQNTLLAWDKDDPTKSRAVDDSINRLLNERAVECKIDFLTGRINFKNRSALPTCQPGRIEPEGTVFSIGGDLRVKDLEVSDGRATFIVNGDLTLVGDYLRLSSGLNLRPNIGFIVLGDIEFLPLELSSSLIFEQHFAGGYFSTGEIRFNKKGLSIPPPEKTPAVKIVGSLVGASFDFSGRR